MRRVDAYLAAMDALHRTDFTAGRDVARQALSALTDHRGRDPPPTSTGPPPRAGGATGRGAAGAPAERAVAIYEQLPPCPGYVEALATESHLPAQAGHHSEAIVLARRAAEVSARLNDPALHKTRLSVLASLELGGRP